MKWALGKERTRVSVSSAGGIVGGHAIDTLIEIDIVGGRLLSVGLLSKGCNPDRRK